MSDRRGSGRSTRQGSHGDAPSNDRPTGRTATGGGERNWRFEPKVQPRSDDAQAFIPDPDERGWSRVSDDLAETLGEGFVASATTGENVEDEALEAVVPEEIGGPFIETTDAQEFGLSTDDMNPEDAEPEPLPRAVSGLVSTPMPEVVEAQLAASGAAAADGSEAVDESDDGGADMLRSERLVDGDEIT